VTLKYIPMTSIILLVLLCDMTWSQEVTEREQKAAMALATQRCESIKEEPTSQQLVLNMRKASAGGTRFDITDLSKKIVRDAAKAIALDLCRPMIAGEESCRLLQLGVSLPAAQTRGYSYAESLMGPLAAPENLATLADRTMTYLNIMCDMTR
jgi:hypothetical protein